LQQWKFGIQARDLEAFTQQLYIAAVRKREQNFAERLSVATAATYVQQNDTGARTVATTGGDGIALIPSAIKILFNFLENLAIGNKAQARVICAA